MSITQVKDAFLWWMGLIYFCAFASIYFQIPGLYGDKGILPAKLALKLDPEKLTFEEYMKTKPTLIWLAVHFEIPIADFMELISLCGLILSLTVMASQIHRNALFFYGLWFMYLSIYQVGQTFMHFQWDILLLEAGFLAIIVAPFLLPFIVKSSFSQPHDHISMWLVKWLLFRLMFASGVVKLTSLCPTWWGLTALNYHFESQCIPTPLAWMFHYFPDWFLKLSVISTFLIEIPIPLLFFSPFRSLRMFSFWSQVLLQLLIILTGNYNFFNMLTLTLAISLLDNKPFVEQGSDNRQDATKKESLSVRIILMKISKFLLTISITISIIWFIMRVFSIKILKDGTFFAKIDFKPAKFASILNQSIPVTIWIAGISLSGNIIYSLYQSLKVEGICSKINSSVVTIFMSCVAIFMFCISMVPHASVSNEAHQSVWPVIKHWHSNVNNYEITHAYGLFRRMTGVGGRPEIVIEGCNSIEEGWKEYQFLYKPGNISESPKFVAPHQPRLDWQMWFAALGTYHRNPWFINLINCLLENRKDVLDLLSNNPFPDKPPKYIQATLYLYNYSPYDSEKRRSNDWWVRKDPQVYLPVLTKDNPALQNYLQEAGLYEEPGRKDQVNSDISKCLKIIRGILTSMQPHTFLWAVCIIAVPGRLLT